MVSAKIEYIEACDVARNAVGLPPNVNSGDQLQLLSLFDVPHYRAFASADDNIPGRQGQTKSFSDYLLPDAPTEYKKRIISIHRQARCLVW